jgi:hypothetical protein
MLSLDRFQKKIASNIIFDIFLLLAQAILLASMYFGHKIDFKYVYYGTLVFSIVFIFRFLYIIIMAIKSIWMKKSALFLGLLFYIFILTGLFIPVIFGGFIPIVGVSTK